MNIGVTLYFITFGNCNSCFTVKFLKLCNCYLYINTSCVIQKGPKPLLNIVENMK